MPDTVMFCVVELVPKLAAKPESEVGLTLTTGPLTVAASDTVRVVTPWVATVRLPVRDPLWSGAARRTATVASASTPALSGVRVSALAVKLPPLSACSKPCPGGKVKVTAPGRPVPLTLKVCVGEGANNAVVIDGNEEAPTLSVGATTDPLTETVRVMGVLFNAPWVLTVTLPERLTAVDDCARRTAILWLSAPFCGVKVNTPAAKLLPSADNSKPTGALTVTLPSNPAPTTGKLCGCEGVPKRVGKAGKVVAATEPLADNVGATVKDVVTVVAAL